MNALVKVQTRLPYNPALETRYGVDVNHWQALTDAIWPSAKTAEGVELALAYCKARNLDPMKRPVHVVPVWSTALGRMTEGVWPGISELRTTAMRTRQYAGCSKTVFGPMLEHTFKGGFKLAFPEWAQKTVFKLVSGQVVAFEGPEVYWLETYATEKKDSEVPNSMWKKRPRGQIDKCAEAAALRMAFPEELGDEATAEEMWGKAIGPVETADPAPRQVRKLHGGFEAPAGPAKAAPAEPEAEATDVEVEDGAIDPDSLDIAAWAHWIATTDFSDVDDLRLRWDARKDELRAADPDLWRTANLAVARAAQEIAEGGQ